MFIKFTEGFTEYKDGPFQWTNDGSAIEVDRRVGDDLIKTGVFMDAGKAIPKDDSTLNIEIESQPRRKKKENN